MASKYNSRFTRAEKLPLFRLTPRDIEAIELAARYRFIDTNHFHDLLGGSITNFRTRLKCLWLHGYLDRPKIQIDYYKRGGGSEPMVYALASNGFRLLKEHGLIAHNSRNDWLKKNSQVTHPFMQHQLMITSFAVKLTLCAANNSATDLFDFSKLIARLPSETAKRAIPFKLKTRIMFGVKPLDVSLEPDYTFALQWRERNKRGYFFVEIDRGTMPIQRNDPAQTSILRKFLAYQAYWKSKTHKSDFGWPNFRVLFVTTTLERARNMQEALLHHPALRSSQLFLFTSLDAIADDVLAHKFIDPSGANKTLAP